MFLELGKAVSFLASIISVYWITVSAFFVPGTRWQERLVLALSRLAIAACICICSGLLFSWPSRSNPDAGQPLTSTLPMRLFLWAAAGNALLFALSWYLMCGVSGSESVYPACR